MCLSSSTAFALVEPLPRGGETIFTVYVVNATGIDLPSVDFESNRVASPDAYVLESLKADACQVQNGVLNEWIAVVLRVAPVLAHSTVNSPLKTRRSPSSDWPAGLVFRPLSNLPNGISLSDSDWAFGPILDLSLQVEQIPRFQPWASALVMVASRLTTKARGTSTT
jgi:hypothetical protein